MQPGGIGADRGEEVIISSVSCNSLLPCYSLRCQLLWAYIRACSLNSSASLEDWSSHAECCKNSSTPTEVLFYSHAFIFIFHHVSLQPPLRLFPRTKPALIMSFVERGSVGKLAVSVELYMLTTTNNPTLWVGHRSLMYSNMIPSLNPSADLNGFVFVLALTFRWSTGL